MFGLLDCKRQTMLVVFTDFIYFKYTIDIYSFLWRLCTDKYEAIDFFNFHRKTFRSDVRAKTAKFDLFFKYFKLSQTCV